ncbi:hypothetical protein B2J93_5465 [Marssonina coronariae]|uniref:Uncharacterized protein n=1 Tax=Diplocarpon coronariae TaxID=2795749 RepID=A0A218Z1N5_9HELO|nr:hypothetical protein B2J93_5465 [Marssonina coronariae]
MRAPDRLLMEHLAVPCRNRPRVIVVATVVLLLLLGSLPPPLLKGRG